MSTTDQLQTQVNSLHVHHSRITLPIPIKVVFERPNHRLVIQSAKEGPVCTQQFLELVKENVITFYNFTNSTINTMTNDLYFI